LGQERGADALSRRIGKIPFGKTDPIPSLQAIGTWEVGEGRSGAIDLRDTDMRIGRKRGRPAQSDVDRLVVSEPDDLSAWDKPVRVRPRLARSGSREQGAAKKPPSLSSAVERAGRGERVVLRRGKKPIAAIVPIKDLRLLERIGDRRDAELARKALAEPGRADYR
jgi:antitoxin (DNA-binding transcriptional repressor) of toxin-antitoxin stability system